MEDLNIVLEIKKLNLDIGKHLFQMHDKNNLKVPPSPLQMGIIGILIDSHDDTVFLKDLQERLCISKAAVSDVIDKMDKKGLVEKRNHKDDLRKIEVVLLDKGKKLYQELNDNMEKINKEILNGISNDELEEFLRIMHKMEENIKKEG